MLCHLAWYLFFFFHETIIACCSTQHIGSLKQIGPFFREIQTLPRVFIIFKTLVTSRSPFLRCSRVFPISLASSLSYGNNYHGFFLTLLALHTKSLFQAWTFKAGSQQRSSGGNTSGLIPVRQVGVIKSVQLPNPFRVFIWKWWSVEWQGNTCWHTYWALGTRRGFSSLRNWRTWHETHTSHCCKRFLVFLLLGLKYCCTSFQLG